MLDKMLSKYSKTRKSIRKNEDNFKELSKYSKSSSGKAIAERVKLMPLKRKSEKTGSRI